MGAAAKAIKVTSVREVSGSCDAGSNR
jgi:hypothetical protein